MALALNMRGFAFYSGGASSSEVPGRWPVSLNGRTYLVDLDHDANGFRGTYFSRRFIAVQKNQQDTTTSPGEHSLSTEDLWRRSVDSWHKGAGQVYLDRAESDEARFRSSKGVNPWTEWALSLLPATGQKRSSANTNLAIAIAGARLYVIDGSAAATYLQYTTDITPASPTFTAVTGGVAAAPTSIASDGTYVYTAHTASGICLTNTAIGTTAQWITGNVTLVRYVKGRLMAAYQNILYNVTTAVGTAGPTALPAALLTHPNPSFAWVDLAEGPANIYAAGYSGDKSIIYRTSVKADGTALDVPVVAGELPDGEIVRAIQGYLGFMLIGSDRGLRLASIDTSGNLTIGALIVTASAVRCFEPQDRFCWFGYTNYDGTSTGLGRVDLSVFTAPVTPAYASDLMATGQGNVLSVATFQNLRVFAVSGLGVYAETTDLVSSGTVDSGFITYGISDQKVSVFYDIRHVPLTGSVGIGLSVDGGAFTTIGTSSVAGSTQTPSPLQTPSGLQTNQAKGETFEVRLTVNRDAVTTTGPTVRRSVLRAYPAPSRGRTFVVPLMLYKTLRISDQNFDMDPKAELDLLETLALSRSLVTYQERAASYSVFVEDLIWIPHQPTPDNQFYDGTCVVFLHSPGQ